MTFSSRASRCNSTEGCSPVSALPPLMVPRISCSCPNADNAPDFPTWSVSVERSVSMACCWASRLVAKRHAANRTRTAPLRTSFIVHLSIVPMHDGLGRRILVPGGRHAVNDRQSNQTENAHPDPLLRDAEKVGSDCQANDQHHVADKIDPERHRC